MFRGNVRIRGQAGALRWSWHDAAVLGDWSITKRLDPKTGLSWYLSARLVRVDTFQIRQRPLYFAAPRGSQGFWAWQVHEIVQLQPDRVTVRLGPPEQ